MRHNLVMTIFKLIACKDTFFPFLDISFALTIDDVIGTTHQVNE